jgi:hypothetical protein
MNLLRSAVRNERSVAPLFPIVSKSFRMLAIMMLLASVPGCSGGGGDSASTPPASFLDYCQSLQLGRARISNTKLSGPAVYLAVVNPATNAGISYPNHTTAGLGQTGGFVELSAGVSIRLVVVSAATGLSLTTRDLPAGLRTCEDFTLIY